MWLKSVIGSGAEWLARNGFYGLADKWGYGGGRSWSGENVTERSALGHSVVWACVRRISGAVGFIPLNLMRVEKGSKGYATDHPAYSALHNAPNAEMGSMTFRETLTAHLLMQGNCFAQILRRSGTNEALELWPLLPEYVTVDREKQGQKRLVYLVKDGNAAEKAYTVERGKPQEILHIRGLGYDGMRGYSVVRMAANSLGNAQAVEKYAGRFFRTGGRQTGFIEPTQKFKTKEDLQEFRDDLDKFVQNPETSHKWPIFEPGMKFVPGGFSPQDSQFIETRQWTTPEICRWFELSPHLAGDLSRATFSNIEQLAQDFVTFCLMYWVKRWEEDLDRCVLTREELAAGYYFKFNVNSLLRGDFLSRMQGYSIALQNGFKSPNEVRDLEDENAFEGGDDFHIQLNMQTLGAGTPTASQQAALLTLGSAKKGAYLQ